MRTLEEAQDYFAYHPATPDTAPRHAAVRDLFAEVVERIWPLVPDGPDKTLVIRALWESQALANLAIARTAPVDTSPTRSVARVLPQDRDQATRVGQCLSGGCNCQGRPE